MNNMYPKGSEWRKWDLHVHTPASALEHSLGDDWDVYVEKLIEAAKVHNITAIATADYFTIDGYKKLLEYYNPATHKLSKNGKTTQIFLIPGIELRLNIFNSKEESINLHIFFDPDCCSPDFINQNFLEGLSISYRGGNHFLKQQNLLAIGKSIVENVPLNVGQSFDGIDSGTKSTYMKKALGAITLASGNINDALKTIDEIFERQKLLKKAYLTAVVGKGRGGIRSLKWFEGKGSFSRAGLIREDLTHQADIIFSNDLSDRNFYLGHKPDTPVSEVESRFQNLKPCVWGSDSHSLDKLLHPSNGNSFDYTWIKAEVSFEGFKQITFEPELRVRIQLDDPSEEDVYAKIDSLEVDFPNELKIKDKESNEAIDFCIRGEQKIDISSNLTCIIGGRGSGKSTLVHILYNQIPTRDSNRLINVNSPLFNLQLGSKDTLTKIRLHAKSDVPSNSEFFLQNEIEKFAKDVNEMSILIKSRLDGLSMLDEDKNSLLAIEAEWGEALLTIDDLLNSYDEITQINKEVSSIEKLIMGLKKQTSVIKSKKYLTLQKEIGVFANQISAFDAFEKEYQDVRNTIMTFIKKIKKLDWNQFASQEVLTSFSADLEAYKTKLAEAHFKAKEKYNRDDYQGKLTIKKSELKKYLKQKGMSPENIGELTDATQQIANLEEQINVLKFQKGPYEETYSQKDIALTKYKDAYKAYETRFMDVSQKLQANLVGLKFDDRQTEITFLLKHNEELLKNAIADFVKNSNASKVRLSTDSITNVLFGPHSKPISELIADEQKIVDVVNASDVADVHTQVLQEMIGDSTFLEKLHLRIKKHYFDIKNIQVQTKLGEKMLENTSFGERCGIVIALVLVAGTNPIIIDQPEDNLDGKYISNVLVPLIRRQKHNRQIILVTRDANIVIGGDSELILILDSEAKGTVLLPATIENKKIRSKYIWILDGGEQAFQKREKKYSIQTHV